MSFTNANQTRSQKRKLPPITQEDEHFIRQLAGIPPEMRALVNDPVKTEHTSLSEEQRAVMALVVEEKKNIFFSGAAGELYFLLPHRPRLMNLL
jgi:hypothetical protein